MMGLMSVDTGAQLAIRGVDRATDQISRSIQKISKGSSLASISDAVGFTGQLSKIEAQILGLAAATKNATDTMSLLTIASASMDEIEDSLLRIKELAVQGSSSALASSDRDALSNEKGLLVDAIQNFSDTTSHNSRRLLDGSLTNSRVHLGSQPNDYMTFSLNSMKSNALGAYLATGPTRAALTAAISTSHSDQQNSTADTNDITFATTNGDFVIDVSANDSAEEVTGKINSITTQTLVSADAKTYGFLSSTDGSATTYTIAINGTSTSSFTISSSSVSDAVTKINLISGTTGVTATSTTENKVLLFDALGGDITVENSSAGPGLQVQAVERDATTAVSGTISLQGTGNNDTTRLVGTLQVYSFASFGITQAGSSSTGYLSTGAANLSSLDTIDLSTVEGAVSALAIVDAAIDQVAAAKGLAGAAESRLQVSESLNAETSLALSDAKSNIHNLDFALETAKLARALVLQKASSAVLAQANASQEVVLKLLEEL